MTTRGQVNSNFYQIVNVDSNANPTQVKPEYITQVSPLSNLTVTGNITSGNIHTGMISANGNINGRLIIKVLESKPDYCNIPKYETYELYKLVSIESLFNQTLLKNSTMIFGVDKDWLNNNNITIKLVQRFDNVKFTKTTR